MVRDGQEISQIIPVKHRDNPHFCQRNAQACGSTEPLRSGSSNCTDVSDDWEGRHEVQSGFGGRRRFGRAGFRIGRERSNRGKRSEAGIRKIIVEMTEGFNSHDGKAASRMYAQDARLVTVRGDVMNGRAEIEKGLNAIFATRAKNATHSTKDVTIRMIKSDVAFAYVINELSGLVTPDGQSLPAHQELSLRVFVRDGGIWQVAAFHNTMIAPFAPPRR
jgi:uncharacterized protein (TIGR02246 family)